MDESISNSIDRLEHVAANVDAEDRHAILNAVHTMQAMHRMLGRAGVLPGAAARAGGAAPEAHAASHA